MTTDPKLIEIAQSVKITPTQLALSWAVQRSTSVIPKSSNLERLRSNLDSKYISIRMSKHSFDVLSLTKRCFLVVELPREIMEQVNELGREAQK